MNSSLAVDNIAKSIKTSTKSRNMLALSFLFFLIIVFLKKELAILSTAKELQNDAFINFSW